MELTITSGTLLLLSCVYMESLCVWQVISDKNKKLFSLVAQQVTREF